MTIKQDLEEKMKVILKISKSLNLGLETVALSSASVMCQWRTNLQFKKSLVTVFCDFLLEKS